MWFAYVSCDITYSDYYFDLYLFCIVFEAFKKKIHAAMSLNKWLHSFHIYRFVMTLVYFGWSDIRKKKVSLGSEQ